MAETLRIIMQAAQESHIHVRLVVHPRHVKSAIRLALLRDQTHGSRRGMVDLRGDEVMSLEQQVERMSDEDLRSHIEEARKAEKKFRMKRCVEWSLETNCRSLIIGLIVGLLLGWGYHWVVSPAGAVECAKQPEMLAEHGRFKHMEGGLPKGEIEEILPAGSILTLIVDRETRDWKIMTVRPDTVTCIVFEGMEWMEPDD